MNKILIILATLCKLQDNVNSFEIICLGTNGGVLDGKLSSYLVKGENENNYIALDGGTILPGIEAALEKGTLKLDKNENVGDYTDIGYIYREKIKGYLISHGHLDHIAGMVISSTEDTKKNIYGSNSTIEVLKSSVFNWKLWPNFGDQGEGFFLNQYKYVETNSNTYLQVENTNYKVKVEKTYKLEETFKVLGPLIQIKKLKGIMIEVSYDNSRADNLLFGHLTPNWLETELEVLGKYSGGMKNLARMNVIVTHIKPSLKKIENIRNKVKLQLQENNGYKINYFFPKQGDKIVLK